MRAMGKNPPVVFPAVVSKSSAAADVCNVIDMDGVEYLNVRLRSAVGTPNEGVLVVPAVGSSVLVARLGDGDSLCVMMNSAIDAIVVNGGEFGGLIKINELTAKLNELKDTVNSLVQAFNSHTHQVATTGSAAAQSGTAAAVTSQAQQADDFNADDYENPIIKH